MFEQQINEFNYIVFDLETTGLEAESEQIIEIAARKIDHHGNVISTFHRFIKLYKVKELSKFIIDLTSITSEVLQTEGSDIHEVMDEFLDYIDDSILVAQNSKFDMGFLLQYYLWEKNICFGRLCIDTINLAKSIYPNQESYKLSELTKLFKVSYDQYAHHRADYDVEITSKILIKQLKILQENNINTIADLLKIENYRYFSVKQKSFLETLMGKNNHNYHKMDVFNITVASKHIDYYLNKKSN